MAQLFCTGPAHIYIGVPNITRGFIRTTKPTSTSYAGGASVSLEGVDVAVTPLYLGTAEKTPKITLRPAWREAFADQGGEVPHDVAFAGEEAFVSADISRWNETTYNVLASRPSHTAGARGASLLGEIGTLMVTEGRTAPLWVVFPYALKPAYASMPGGYHFVASFLVGPDELEPLGTNPRKIRLIWRCLRKYIPGSGTYQLYDHNVNGLPSPD